MKKVLLSFHLLFISLVANVSAQTFQSDFPANTTRYWVGSDYWANRLQDWQVRNGRLECLVAEPNRNVHLLTYQLSDHFEDFEVSVKLGLWQSLDKKGMAGVILGAKGIYNHYWDSAVYGKGFNVGVSTQGEIVVGNQRSASIPTLKSTLSSTTGISLKISGTAINQSYAIRVQVLNESGESLGEFTNQTTEKLNGNVALLADIEKGGTQPSFWFDNWQISGKKLQSFPSQIFGPVLFSLYTVSKKVLKLTAQLVPIGVTENQNVELQIKFNDDWITIASSPIDPMARTATFRIDKWNDAREAIYRVRYQTIDKGNKPQDFYWSGIIRKNPTDKPEIKVAAFSCGVDYGFLVYNNAESYQLKPNRPFPVEELPQHAAAHNADLLAFLGDQIYEPNGGYGVQYSPLEPSMLDYLRKWYLFGIMYRDLLKNTPSICLLDDHDYFHGNIWGTDGKPTIQEGNQKDKQDSGGFKQPAAWVNAAQRTQTSHLPDPYDPTPIEQGIGVYYTDLHWGGISFGLIEDRKWKSAPALVLPKELKISNGWAEASRTVPYDQLDPVGTELLGQRQIKFLNQWTTDWSNQTWMKAVLSQTTFCTIATLPADAVSDVVVPNLPILKKGEYAPDDLPTQDMDSNGWPRSKRNEAVRIIRKSFALHIGGDQHLPSTAQYGVEDFGDASYAVCVPATTNIWPRRWYPNVQGQNQPPNAPKNMGDFIDGFGNKITVKAVANPTQTTLQPAKIYERATGYGIVKFTKATRNIEIAIWPRETDPTTPNAKPYDGWPVVLNQADNFAKKALGYLPTIQISGLKTQPVVQVIDEKTGELQYALRLNTHQFRPKVFTNSTFTLRIGEPDTHQWKELKGIKINNNGKLKVQF
ncbi:MAG: alkaline phosphatase D family protein [Spirosomataceae bacterium]